MVKDHPPGGPDLLVAGIEPGHFLIAPQGPADLALDQAEHEQGQADHRHQCGDSLVVLHEDGRDSQGTFEVTVAALDRALLALVASQYLGGVGLLGG